MPTGTLTVPTLWPTATVMAWPLARVTTTGVPVTGAERLAVYRMLPFSLADVLAVRVTVVVSTESLITVRTGAGFASRCSKLPPEADVMLVLSVLAPWYTSFAACNDTLPLLWPAAMLMTWPLDRLTVTAVCAGLLRVTV